MKDLADTNRVVPIGLEMLGKRSYPGINTAEVGSVGPDPRLMGAPSGQNGRTGGVAQTRLAVGAPEHAAPAGQLVQMRGHHTFRTVATERIRKVVGNDEQYIWSCHGYIGTPKKHRD